MDRRKFFKKGAAAAAVALMGKTLLANNLILSNQQGMQFFLNSNAPIKGIREITMSFFPSRIKNAKEYLGQIRRSDNKEYYRIEIRLWFDDNLVYYQPYRIKRINNRGDYFVKAHINSRKNAPSYFKKEIKFKYRKGSTESYVELKYSNANWLKLKYQAPWNDGCFLTTACVQSKQLPDDCHELQTLRKLRDDYMLKTDKGQRLITHYYAIAPSIVAKIDSMANSKTIYDFMYQTLVMPTISYVEADEYKDAMQYYQEYTEALEELILN